MKILVAAVLVAGSDAASDEKVKRVQTMDAQTRRWLIAMSIAIALLIFAMLH
jgi:hypothetical protein